MTMVKRIAIALAFAATLGAVQAGVPLIERERVLLVQQQPSADAVKAAIVGGSGALGWRVLEDQPGRLRLRYDKGSSHGATVDVLYDAAGYQIKYVDSSNLDFDGAGKIHNTYNRWTANLIKYIGLAHGRAPQ